MAFRVLIIGGRQRVEYARLRDALDALLVNRLPDVEIVTAGGPGVPALAASYAKSRGLKCAALPLDYEHHLGNAVEWRDSRLVELADAAVLVGDATEVWELLERAIAKGLRVATISAVEVRREPVEEVEPDDGTGMLRGLPD